MAFTETANEARAMSADGRRWLLIEGVVLIVLGVAALILPLAAGAFAGVLLGWLLVISGVVGLIATWRGGGHLHLTWSLASAIIAILAGLLIAFRPLVGALAITLLVAAYLFVDGVSHIGLATDQRRRAAPRWGWMLALGMLDILLAVFLLFLGPIGAGVLVGIIAGVDLIIGGVLLLQLGRAMPALAPQV